jgi:glycosyltransferase
MPHLTLITATFNSAKTLSDTIESILEQIENYPELAQNLEYIIIDGASTDDTIKIVERYQNSHQLNIRLISEPDHGIFDAMNKGIKLATGDIVGIINSDDFYHSPTVLQKVLKAFESNPTIDAIYGDLMYVQNDDITKQTRYWKAGEYREENLNWGWSIPHPTFFVARRVYEKLIEKDNRVFDTTTVISACYELTFRLLKIYKIKVKYLPEILVTMRDGGTSASSLSQRITGWREQRMVWKINHLPVPYFFITRRLMHKIWQFIKLHK